MGVDTTGDPTRSFYDGHGHPFLSKVGGMARPFRIGATGGLACRCKPDQSPQLGDGTCRLSMCGWLAPVDDVFQRHETPSQTAPTSTPEAIENQLRSGGPLEKYQRTGGSGRPATKARRLRPLVAARNPPETSSLSSRAPRFARCEGDAFARSTNPKESRVREWAFPRRTWLRPPAASSAQHGPPKKPNPDATSARQ